MTEAQPLSSLVRFARFPQVVTLGPVGELKARLRQEGDSPSRGSEAELRSLLQLYFIDAPANRRTWEALLGSLARVEGPGRGFLISGAYGSGKSHLLAALSLLCEHAAAWNHFLSGHPWARSFARAFAPARRLIAVHVALDQYRGESHVLESIVFRAIEDELRACLGDGAPTLVEESAYLDAFERLIVPPRSAVFSRFLSEQSERRGWARLATEDRAAALRLARCFMRSQGIEVALERPRAETLMRLGEALRGAGYHGLVLLIDELSLFLASKDKRGLDEDAAFLQFLGQAGRTLPLWVVAATQRDLEDVGDIDSHTLRQIRDRYESHHLSLAQLRTVIERKLVEKPDARAFAAAVREACDTWGDGDRARLSFSAEELARTYPFNPLALEAFQSAAESFLSQTRSVVQAVSEAVASGTLAQGRRLISADAAFDLAAERLDARPELARLAAARRFYSENARRIVPQDSELVEAVFKALALAAVAGTRWTVREIADALAGSAARADQGAPFRRRVESTLKAMRRRGAYVECVPHAEQFADQYFLEISSDLGEALRRRLYELTDALGERDSRIFEHAAAACRDPSFPLAALSHPRQEQFEWMNTARRVTVERRDLRRLRPEHLSRTVEALATPGTPECGWLVVGEMRDVAAQREGWLEAAGQVAGRWAQGLIAWLPRPLREDELETLREHAALCLLAADPTAREGEHGRALAQRVTERLALQQGEAIRAVRDAYAQGEFLRADGRCAEVARISSADEWHELLAGIFDWPLRELFPRFRDIAPRKRLVGKQRSTFVIEEFLRPGRAAPAPDSALEEALACYLEPMGLAQRDREQWVVSVQQSRVAQAVLELVPERRSATALDAAVLMRFADCAAIMEKSEWGLTPEMVELAVGALLRVGHLVALDGFLKPMPVARLGTPLSDHVTYLARAVPMPDEDQKRVLAVAQALFGEAPPALDVATQSALWERLCAWARDAPGCVEQLESALAGLYDALGHGPAQWAESRRAIAAARELAAAIQPDSEMSEGLKAAAAMEQLASALAHLSALQEFMCEDAQLAALAFRYLNDARLKTADPRLARLRQEILALWAQGEGVIAQRTELRRKVTAFIADYAACYRQHHDRIHSGARFRAYADLRRAPELRALLALAPLRLSNRAGEAEAAIRAQMERHCAGTRLHQALREQPVCPDCGLTLDGDLELADAGALLAQCRDALRAELAQLARHRDDLARALQSEGEARATAVRRALNLAQDAPAESVLQAFSPPVVEWVAQALAQRGAARAPLAELQAFLRGKRLTREQALRAFAEWLSAHGARGDADAIEFE